MTKDDPVKHLFQELSSDDIQQPQQQQQKPFHVVLVDIEKAAKDLQIYCVEKPLEGDIDEELSFVALSYRWGECQEQLVDTECGYIASVTSFDLHDFKVLCSAIHLEPDRKSIKYVWVDAICVDQTNYERRKATIHQMSTIYEKATYILAVPDLHQAHLKNVSQSNVDVIYKLHKYTEYIYYLIQRNNDKLTQLDSEFLDNIGVPKDPMLRRMLTKYTQCFMDGFTKKMHYIINENTNGFVQHLYDISQAKTLMTNDHPYADAAIGKNQTQADRYASFEDLVFCDNMDMSNDLDFYNEWHRKKMECGIPTLTWKDMIIERNNAIRQVMEYLEDLIIDWSSRVWCHFLNLILHALHSPLPIETLTVGWTQHPYSTYNSIKR
ncbi:hypothetical protein BCR42DRAFT_152679 [Absidia repens]|uniref:Heterokaryon incompatibility domain-containing protein n=1 Tax=Absidia repens TaxID=90262 RepID=A0A1X2I311_9FUNG|nr:hypothetical protein BCR42DRAFT_152679 [Absidia repens]